MQASGVHGVELGADELPHVREHHLERRLRAQGGQLPLELDGLPEVVGVEEGEQVAAGQPDAVVAGRPDACRGLPDAADRRPDARG